MNLASTGVVIGAGASLLGIVGWIIAIIATSKRAGRGQGITGIVLGIAAPIVACVILIVMVLPTVTLYPQ